jgi:DNA-binding SARP family transcriptional activator/TolB-like protein
VARLSSVTLKLLGRFGAEINVARSIPVSIRLRKSRALLAFLAMKPGYEAAREELATLLWGDHLDTLARHNLRQCLTSLRQDLRLAPDLVSVERSSVALQPRGLFVDAREFCSLTGSADDQAAQLYHGEFLADLTLDSEEFVDWRQREADLIKVKAAQVFGALAARYDQSGDGPKAVEAVERLIGLEPTREDFQRTALIIWARHRGRDVALSRASEFVKLLKRELDVSPERETRAVIESIKNGSIQAVRGRIIEAPAAAIVVDGAALANVAARVEPSSDPDSIIMAVARSQLSLPAPKPAGLEIAAGMAEAKGWNWPIGSVLVAGLAALVLFTTVYLYLTGPLRIASLSSSQSVKASVQAKAFAREPMTPLLVMPFLVDTVRGVDDQRFAQALTHDLTDYLSRYQQLRVISAQASDREDAIDMPNLGAELGAPYAVVGRARINGTNARAAFKLVETATRVILWSDDIDRERVNVETTADEMSRGIARALAIQVTAADARRKTKNTGKPIEPAELVTRGRAAEQVGPWTENLSEAARLFEQALQHDQHFMPAMLGIARVAVMAEGNWVELNPPIELARAEQLLREVLRRSPNSSSAHYIFGQLLKLQGRYAESLQSFQRALELNPSFIFANAHIGSIKTQLGQPEEGLKHIEAYMHVAPNNEPAMGYAHLYVGQAELALGHPQNALEAILHANSFFPDSPRILGWLAAVYSLLGDNANATRFAVAFQRSSPYQAARILSSVDLSVARGEGAPPSVVLNGLRAALIASRS